MKGEASPPIHDATTDPRGPVVRTLAADRLDDVARLHLRSVVGYLNTKLGYRYIYRLFEWFSRAPDALCLVAEDAGSCVGYAFGAPVGYHRAFARALIPSVARAFAARPWLFASGRILRALSSHVVSLVGKSPHPVVPPDLPAPRMVLVGIAVDSRARGRGIGGLLLDEFADEAARRGMRSMELTVYATNAEARRLYERCGWSAVPCPESSPTLTYIKVL